MTPKKLLLAAAGLFVALLIVAGAAALFVDVDVFRPQLQQAISTAAGRAVVEERGGRTRSRTYDDVQFETTDVSGTTRFPFRASAKAPGNRAMTLEGFAGPVSPAGVGATPVDARLAIKRLDLAGTGLI